MKKITLFLILIIFLSGCSLCNLNDFILPNDIDFINIINELDNPEKICSYMRNNFIYEPHVFSVLDPYKLWKTKKGDCNDTATFAQFVANYHGYTTYQVRIYFKKTYIKHIMAIFKEDGKYTYVSETAYFPIYTSSFNDIILDFLEFPLEYELDYYEIYDYDMNLIN